ncbi:MAG: M23 family metallopeptidase [bacterium]|nr:M23 family metallopeptidase [bacterium]
MLIKIKFCKTGEEDMKKLNMMRKVVVLLFVMVLSCVNSVYSDGFLTLPIKVNVNESGMCHYGCYAGHLGTDWSLSEGSDIIAPCDAVVEKIQDNIPHYDFGSGIMSFGNNLKLDVGMINGHQIDIVLAHCLQNSFFVTEGNNVTRGQRLALSGNSGTTTGPHLDMTVYIDGIAVDPYSATNWLWTTNPPVPGQYNPFTNFTFKDKQPQGFTAGYDADVLSPEYSESILPNGTWGISTKPSAISGKSPNPGVVSPSLPAGFVPAELPYLIVDFLTISS